MRIFILIIILSTVLFAGDEDRISPSSQENLWSQGFILDSYHSIGFSDINQSLVAEIISSNPANITAFKNFELGINYEYATKIDNALFSEIGQSKNHQWLPNSFGSHVSLKNFHFGIGGYRKYSSSLDFDPIPITTVENMDGESGKTFTPVIEKSLFTFGGIVAYDYPNLVIADDALSIGLQLNLDYFRAFETVPNTEVTRTGNDISWKVGLNYDIEQYIQIGIVYESGTNITGSYQIDNLMFVQDSLAQNYSNRPYSYDFKVRLPQKIAFGLGFNLLSSAQISAGITKIQWQDINDQVEDNYEFSMHTVIALLDNFRATAGIYHNWLSMKKSDQYAYSEDNDFTYLNLGLLYKFKNIEFVAEIYDSHWQSIKSMERTIYKFGIGYSFASR